MPAPPAPQTVPKPPENLDTSSRVVAVVNGKGGVGKTTITANTGGECARDGYRVLLVSFDPQDNLGEDLGYANAGMGDDGHNMSTALLQNAPLQPLVGIRENLDVIPGGDALEDVVRQLYVDEASGVDRSWALAGALAPLLDDYDLVLIDCPPGYHILQHLALCASRWILVPTATDASSRKGLSRLATRVTNALSYNPHLRLLGVVLFDIPVNASRIRDKALRSIRDDLGHGAPIFTASIRTATAAANDARERGQLISELARDVSNAGPFWKRDKKSGPALATSALNLAQDYKKLTDEVITTLVAEEDGEEQA